jgi:hypothetical protein
MTIPKNNTGDCNTGDRNTGDRNTGGRNTGSWNTGDCNTGYWNTGSWNTGSWNTGDYNTGDRNTGDRNTGDRNTGDCNTGDRNTGARNTGDRNTGGRNTGDWNTGRWNTGSWNTGSWNTGFFNTITPESILVFNKKCTRILWNDCQKPNWIYFNLQSDRLEWVSIDNMTEQQKIDNPTYYITVGFLLLEKSNFSKEDCYKKSAQKSWDNATHEDRMLTYKLPNFDADIAQEIFGIDFKAYLSKIDNNIIEIDGVKYKKIN